MVNLDNQDIYKQYDTEDMASHLHGLPEQCLEAWQKANDFKLPADYADINKIVICGMGGSAISGDLLSSLVSSSSRASIYVHRDYGLPAFVNEQTLVIAASYSGMTEETLSAFSQSLKTDCKKLAITTGGTLKKMAQEKDIPVFHINYTSPPRAALGWGVFPLLAFASKLGITGNEEENVSETVQMLEELRGRLQENMPLQENPAKKLALNLYGKIAILYGAGFLSPVARRWKGQLNENGKTWAFYEAFPELNHNAVVGYEFPREMAEKLFVVMLRSSDLHQRTLARYHITGELLEKSEVGHQVVDSEGKSLLCQMMSTVFLGDWTSYYLAMLNEIDPTPVKTIGHLKKRLSEL